VMHASMWFEFFGGFFNFKAHDTWEGNVTIRSEIEIESTCSLRF
jgi:hypothetical protein